MFHCLLTTKLQHFCLLLQIPGNLHLSYPLHQFVKSLNHEDTFDPFLGQSIFTDCQQSTTDFDVLQDLALQDFLRQLTCILDQNILFSNNNPFIRPLGEFMEIFDLNNNTIVNVTTNNRKDEEDAILLNTGKHGVTNILLQNNNILPSSKDEDIDILT